MYFNFLGADHAPATFGLDAAIRGFGTRTAMAQHVTVRHLEKAVRRRHRTYLHRFE
jgi:hypothetical protein